MQPRGGGRMRTCQKLTWTWTRWRPTHRWERDEDRALECLVNVLWLILSAQNEVTSCQIECLSSALPSPPPLPLHPLSWWPRPSSTPTAVSCPA